MNKYTFTDLAIILQDEFEINVGVANVGKPQPKPQMDKEEARLKLCEILNYLAREE